MTTLERHIEYLRGCMLYMDLDDCEIKTMQKILEHAESLREYEIDQLKSAFFAPCPDPAFHNIQTAFQDYYNDKIKNSKL